MLFYLCKIILFIRDTLNNDYVYAIHLYVYDITVHEFNCIIENAPLLKKKKMISTGKRFNYKILLQILIRISMNIIIDTF